MYTQLQETTQKQKQVARVPVARENIATAHNEMLRMSTMDKSGHAQLPSKTPQTCKQCPLHWGDLNLT